MQNISINGKVILKKNIFTVLVDHKLYFIVALFAGEAGPEIFLSSGFMYIFALLGTILIIVNSKVKVRYSVSFIFLFYGIIIIRNISLNPDVFYYYELPNIVTAYLLLIICYLFFENKDINRIEFYIFVYAFSLCMLGIVKFFLNPGERLAVFGGPNGYYKIALLFEVFCFFYYQTKKKWIYLLGMVIGLLLCIATGSKGGIVTMVGVVGLECVAYIINSDGQRRRLVNRFIKIVIILSLGFGVLKYAIDKMPGLSDMIERAGAFFTSKNLAGLSSISARTELFSLGIQFFYESPLIGKGARSTFFYTNGVQPYSHNIFIETLSENGLLAAVPLILFFVLVIYKTIKGGIKDNHSFFLFLCVAVYLSGSLFSGNVLDAKPIFLFGILLINYSRNRLLCYKEI